MAVFAITGRLSRPRREIVAAIEQAGHRVASSLNNSVQYLVEGASDRAMPSAKMHKALERNVHVINEAQLHRMLNSATSTPSSARNRSPRKVQINSPSNESGLVYADSKYNAETGRLTRQFYRQATPGSKSNTSKARTTRNAVAARSPLDRLKLETGKGMGTKEAREIIFKARRFHNLFTKTPSGFFAADMAARAATEKFRQLLSLADAAYGKRGTEPTVQYRAARNADITNSETDNNAYRAIVSAVNAPEFRPVRNMTPAELVRASERVAPIARKAALAAARLNNMLHKARRT